MSSPNLTEPEESRPSLPPARPQGAQHLPKNPVVALALSAFVPGIGQAYNGHTAKAFVFFLGLVGSLYAVIEIAPLPYAFLLPFVYFWGLVDAYRSADLINLKAQGGTPEAEETQESAAWGAALVFLGAVILASNLHWLDLAALHRFWPVLLIVFGLVFMWRSVLGRKVAG
jgi:hypothetical protein